MVKGDLSTYKEDGVWKSEVGQRARAAVVDRICLAPPRRLPQPRSGKSPGVVGFRGLDRTGLR